MVHVVDIGVIKEGVLTEAGSIIIGHFNISCLRSCVVCVFIFLINECIHYQLLHLHVGSLPDWLSGKLIRNGPGLLEIGDTKLNHWFDGMALLHSFTIKSGIKLLSLNCMTDLITLSINFSILYTQEK